MSVPLILILVVPLGAAALAPAFGDVPVQRRAVIALVSVAAIGAAAWAVVRTVTGSAVAWRGFSLDPWRALLVFGALLVSIAAASRAEHSHRPALAHAAVFAATAAGVMSLAVSGTQVLALTLPVGTAGVAVASLAVVDGAARELRAVRSVTALALSDVLALTGLGIAIGKGNALPPIVSTGGAALLLAAALIRLGITPAAGPSEDAHDAHAAIGLLWLGPVRAQGFLLAVFAVAAHRNVAYAGAAAAVAAIVVTGATAPRRASGVSLPAIATAVALLGFALGGATATWGAVLAAAAAFAAPAAASAGAAWSAAARATLAALAGGGLIVGATLVLGAAFGAGAVQPWFLALALPATVGLLAASGAVWFERERELLRGATATISASIGIAAGLALAAVPARASAWLAEPVSRTFGVGRLLSVGGEPGIAEGLAVVVLVAGLLAFAVGPGRLGSGGASQPREKRRVIPFDWWARAARAPLPGSGTRAVLAAEETRRWVYAATFLFVVAVGLAARVYVAAAGRGFL